MTKLCTSSVASVPTAAHVLNNNSKNNRSNDNSSSSNHNGKEHVMEKNMEATLVSFYHGHGQTPA